MGNLVQFPGNLQRFDRGNVFERPITISAQALRATLAEEVEEPFRTQAGTGIIPNRDPVLRRLAPAAGFQYMDERVYKDMETTESKLQDARRHLESEIFAHGFEIQQGSANNRAARRWEELAELIWSRIPHKATVLSRIHDCHYYGWRPMQVLVDTELRFRNSAIWAPFRIVDKPPHRVRKTDRDTVVWMGDPSMFGAQEFDPTETKLGWMLPSVGSLHHEYGEGTYHSSFLLVYTKRQIFRKFTQGMDRAMGLMKAQKSDLVDLQESAQEIKDELAGIVDVLNNYNILVEAGGWTFEVISNLNFVDSAVKSLEFLDDCIMQLGVGEILTSNPGDRGTQALGTVHRSVKTDYAKKASEGSVEEPMNELFRTFIEANFGPQDPEEYPRFVNRLRLQVKPEAVQKLFDMGAGINVTRLAEVWDADAIVATGNEDAETLIAVKGKSLMTAEQFKEALENRQEAPEIPPPETEPPPPEEEPDAATEDAPPEPPGVN